MTEGAPPANPAERQRVDAATTWRHRLTLAAGAKALYTATGRFTAGIDEERMAFQIFDGTPTADILRHLTTTVDDAGHAVMVSSEHTLPRIAVWRPVLGSTQLPVGATMAAAAHVPRLPADVTAPDLDEQPWPLGDADAHGPASPLVERLAGDAIAGSYGGESWGVLVAHRGAIIAEDYAEGFDRHTQHRTNSVAKSVAASVIGVAVQAGLLDPAAPAPVPEWAAPGDPRAAITLDDLLRMSSGLFTEAAGNPQQELYYGGAAVAERAARNTLDSRPGTRWVYAGADTALAVRALRSVLDDDDAHLRFPFERLLWRIGMTRTTLETDWNGDFLLSGDMWSSVRDLARLGLLHLADGRWDGQRILPAGWCDYVTTETTCRLTQDSEPAYGAQFWLYGAGQGLPPGSFAAAGARGQYVMIVPSRDLVVVRRGFDRGEQGFDIARFTREVVASL